MSRAARPNSDREFRDWLRRTIRRLEQADLPPEDDELARSPYDDPGVQRRIADLIGSIAEQPERRNPKRKRR